jgi:DegV family protein with EDD domain
MKGKRVVVITDSSACLPADLVRELGIVVVPVRLVAGSRVYSDGVDLQPSEFYERLRQGERFTTASPNIGEYLAAYEAASREAEGALCICVPSSFASMYGSAQAAAAMCEGFPVRVVDCTTAAGGQGLVALAAARLAARGAALADVEQAAREAMARVRLVATVDTLEYLHRSGRAPWIAERGTSLLQIKPLLTVQNGEAKLLRLARTRRGAIDEMVKIAAGWAHGAETLQVIVQHAGVLEEANALAQKLHESLRPGEMYVTEFTPVMGSHTGPGVLLVALLGA